MIIVEEELWLCEDCTQAAVNDDYTGLDYYLNEPESSRRMQDIQEGLAALGRRGYLTPDWTEDDGEDEFSTVTCDCCGESLAGRRMKFALLGE